MSFCFLLFPGRSFSKTIADDGGILVTSVLRFFPEELWSTLDPSHALSQTQSQSQGEVEGARAKKLQISRQRPRRLGEPGDEDVDEVAGDTVVRDEKEDNTGDEADDEPAEADVETDYEDDEEDMEDDDYNAEKYFEDAEGEENEAYNEGPEDMDL